ncbi:MAG: hypothetical protein AB1531_08065 [Chloroflexota bacterium]
MKKIIFFLVAGIVILGCSIPSFFSPTPDTVIVDCSNIAITDADVNSTLEYGTSLLTRGDWKRSYTVNTDQVYATYISDELNAVVFVDTLALCNARTELRAYANEDNLAVILANYEKYTPVDSCEKDGVLLFQFTAFNNETNYNVNIWFSPLENPHRALTVVIVFPQADFNSMEEYSAAFFPALTACK